jgi:hypothetical protein
VAARRGALTRRADHQPGFTDAPGLPQGSRRQQAQEKNVKAVLVVEDRDTGYVILDVASIPDMTAIGPTIDLSVQPGLDFQDAICGDDNDVIWVQTDRPDGTIGVEIRRFETEGYEALQAMLAGPSYQIPSCTVLLDYAEYERQLAG